MKRLITALLAVTIIASAAFAVSPQEADAATPTQCLAQAGLTLANDGYIDIAGMSNNEWSSRYWTYQGCVWGTWTYWYTHALYEDGSVLWYNGAGYCLPLAVCNA